MSTNELGFVTKTIELIKPGDYDAVIHGIINLGMRAGSEQTFTNKETGLKETKITDPAIFLRFILEFPNDIRNDGQSHVIAKNVKLSDYIPKKAGGMESAFYKLLKTLGETPTRANIYSYMSKEGLSKFAGKALVATIINQTSQTGNDYARVKELTRLHKAVTPPTPTREFFYFNPRDPDLDMFKNTLTYWTQKDIMEAIDSEFFPAGLHELWAKIQEDRVKSSEVNTSALKTEAIE